MLKAPGTPSTTLAGGQQYAPKKTALPRSPFYQEPEWGQVNQRNQPGSMTLTNPHAMPAGGYQPSSPLPPRTMYQQAPTQTRIQPTQIGDSGTAPWARDLPSAQSQINQMRGASGASGTNVQSSVTPGNVYDEGLTTAARNQGVAQALAASNPYSANKAVTRPGFSRGAGTERLAAPIIAQGQANAAQAASMIPYSDQMTNLQFNLRGQQARDAEGQGWANLANQQNSFDNSIDLGNKRSAASLLQAILGGNY
jgi:hypothetical protein